MKYSELKRKVEELGFEVIDWGGALEIANEEGEVAWVSKLYTLFRL